MWGCCRRVLTTRVKQKPPQTEKKVGQRHHTKYILCVFCMSNSHCRRCRSKSRGYRHGVAAGVTFVIAGSYCEGGGRIPYLEERVIAHQEHLLASPIAERGTFHSVRNAFVAFATPITVVPSITPVVSTYVFDLHRQKAYADDISSACVTAHERG